MDNIRFKQQDLDHIIRAFHHFFPEQDHLWLFGSRVNPQAKGGDIDLYIETTLSNASSIVEKKMAMVNELYRLLGEQKIDVVINKLDSQHELPIHKIAKTQGVQIA